MNEADREFIVWAKDYFSCAGEEDHNYQKQAQRLISIIERQQIEIELKDKKIETMLSHSNEQSDYIKCAKELMLDAKG